MEGPPGLSERGFGAWLDRFGPSPAFDIGFHGVGTTWELQPYRIDAAQRSAQPIGGVRLEKPTLASASGSVFANPRPLLGSEDLTRGCQIVQGCPAKRPAQVADEPNP